MKTKNPPKTAKSKPAGKTRAVKTSFEAKKRSGQGVGKQEKHAGGRPTDYRPEMCGAVVMLGKDGKSFTQIAELLDLSRDTLYEWAKVHPEFSDALARARQAAQAWWETAGQSGLVTPGFAASLWQKNMSCRFPDDWRDVTRQENTGANGGPQLHKHDVSISPEDSYKRMLGG